MNKKIKAFTLVELVVSIVIISILSTIGFVSFSLYTKDARDSVRISDLKNIEKSMSLLMSKGGDLVKPDKVGEDEETESKYGLTWEVGVFGNNNIEKTSLNDLPLDPTTKQPYKYLYNGDYNYYILETELENGEKIVLSNFKGINEKFTDENCFLYNEKDDGTLSITGLKNECLNILDIKIPYEINGKKVFYITSLTGNYDSIYAPGVIQVFGRAFYGSNIKKLYFPQVIDFNQYALEEANIGELKLPYVKNLSLSYIHQLDFLDIESATKVYFPSITIKKLNGPKLKNISGYIYFLGEQFYLPNLETISGEISFSVNSSLDIPKIKIISNNSISGAIIKNKSFPDLFNIGNHAFGSSKFDYGFDAPKLETIGDYALHFSLFKNGKINIPSIKSIGIDAFPGDFTGTITIPSSFDDSNYQWPSGATIIKK